MNDVKRNKDNREKSKNDLDSFTLIDEPIDLSVQEEYIRFSETIDFDNVDYEEVLTESDKLFDKHTPIALKKRILILLAHRGTPESCRILEKYLRISEGNLRHWALLSLKECRAFLESVLLQEEGGFISTGLGGIVSAALYEKSLPALLLSFIKIPIIKKIHNANKEVGGEVI